MLILAVFCLVQQAKAAQYQCTALDLPTEASWGRAYGINDSGQVVGNAGGGEYHRGILWNGTTAAVLSLPSGAASGSALDINDASQVAGMVTIDGDPRPVRWDAGNPTLLGLPPRPVNWGDVRAVNEAGQIAGRQQNSGSLGKYEPVRWDGSVPIELNLGPYLGGELRDINDSANSVGSVYHATNGWQPALWNGLDPSVLEMPDVHPVPSGHAYAINNMGQIAGTVESSYAVRWDSGVPSILDLPIGMWLVGVTDINDLGQVVGSLADSSGSYPVLWNGSEPLLLPLPDGYSSGEAYGLNSSGEVVGYVWSSELDAQPARWGIVPIPSTALLLAPGLGVLAWMRKMAKHQLGNPLHMRSN
ncbi:MAG: hypothetical protein SWQ30_22005 [Thermodesulfobacteriota bacterium]|nr:hypothetical protein [Thermodesulfobacteriota bacterium]